MKIEPTSLLPFNPEAKTVSVQEQHAPTFTHFLTDSISDTHEKLNAADAALQHLASGETTSLHQTMLRMEEAKLSFQFLEQIRNRLMSAYQDILREQI